MRIGVPKEATAGERRVALAPESGKKLLQAGYDVVLESGAGASAGFPDVAYREAGVVLESSQAAVLGSDLVLKVNAPEVHEIAAMRSGGIVLGSLMHLRHLGVVRALAERGVTSFSTDAIPRTTRAQAMDTLSSMANIAGYKGALLAAVELNIEPIFGPRANRATMTAMATAAMIRPYSTIPCPSSWAARRACRLAYSAMSWYMTSSSR